MTPEEILKGVLAECPDLTTGQRTYIKSVIHCAQVNAHAEGYAKGLEDAARVVEACCEKFPACGVAVAAIRALTPAPHSKNLELDDT